MPKGAKYGGRQKGTPNSERKELFQLMAENFPGWHPVVAMAEIANDTSLSKDIRLTAMKEVAKYVAPQLKAIEHSGSVDAVQTITVEIFKHGDKG